MSEISHEHNSNVWNVSPQHILNCQFAEWYPLYKDVTFKSEIISLPDQFLMWLKADGVSLPQNTPTSLFSTPNKDEDHSDDSSSENDLPIIESTEFDFQELNNKVKKAIDNLGGVVFPKLNWSSPQDASWMNMGNLKCLHPGDAYLLLKSSDFVSHDLHYPFDSCTNNHSLNLPTIHYTLILRKYQNLRPERSFRCFIRNRLLVGISQRDCTAYYPQLQVEMGNISTSIDTFLNSKGRKKNRITIPKNEEASVGRVETNETLDEHPEEGTLLTRFPDKDFIADVYVDQSLKVWLVDINMWAESTDSLMFAWNEPPLSISDQNNALSPPSPTSEAADERVISPLALMRIVDSESCLRPLPFSDYKAPLEMHQFSQGLQSGGGGGSAEGLSEFIAFMAQCENDNNKQ